MILSKIDSDFCYVFARGAEPGVCWPSLQEIRAGTGISMGKLREQRTSLNSSRIEGDAL